jgi:hypothetical protein
VGEEVKMGMQKKKKKKKKKTNKKKKPNKWKPQSPKVEMKSMEGMKEEEALEEGWLQS